MIRYEAKGYAYPRYYSVECPNCKKEATVEDGTLLCKHCFEKIEEIIYLSNIHLKRNCPDCGESIYVRETGLKVIPEKMKVVCSICFFKIEDIPTIEKKYRYKPDIKSLKGDPYFGYSLWFQSEIKGNLFWGYNREHLVEIKTYIESDLREVSMPRGYKMVTRLPHFIRDAKNRDIVIKTIDRMLRK